MTPPANAPAKASPPPAIAPSSPALPASLRAGGAGASSTSDPATWIRQTVEQFETPLAQYCTRLLAGDMDRARDVVQDAFLKLWTADRSEIEGHIGQWLYRVCRNRALDIRRKESRMTTLQDEKLDVMGGRASSGAGDTRERDEERLSPSRQPHTPEVIELLESLNDTQQEALRLKFQGGLSYKEIASVMDITSNHVGVLIHNAIKALRERMTAPAAAPAGTGAPSKGARP